MLVMYMHNISNRIDLTSTCDIIEPQENDSLLPNQ